MVYYCSNKITIVCIYLSPFQSIGDGGQGWGNILLYVFSSPKIRQRLWNTVRHPNLRDFLGLGNTSTARQSQMNGYIQGSKEQRQVSINDSTSFTTDWLNYFCNFLTRAVPIFVWQVVKIVSFT